MGGQRSPQVIFDRNGNQTYCLVLMGKNVVRFPGGGEPTAEALVRRIRELSAAPDTNNVDFSKPHFREQMAKRQISMRQVLDVLRNGEAASRPLLDQYGDWRIKVRKVSAGR